MTPITYPQRPVNGGPLDRALTKIGDWRIQPKFNEWRILVHIPSGSMFNRHNLPLTIAHMFDHALMELNARLGNHAKFEWADCGGMGRRHEIGKGTLVVYDVVPSFDHDHEPYHERRSWIDRALNVWTPLDARMPEEKVFLAPSYPGTLAPTIWHELQEANKKLGCDFYEGLVAYRANARYAKQLISAEQETSSLVKHRFIL